jgi:hypothetical protein
MVFPWNGVIEIAVYKPCSGSGAKKRVGYLFAPYCKLERSVSVTNLEVAPEVRRRGLATEMLLLLSLTVLPWCKKIELDDCSDGYVASPPATVDGCANLYLTCGLRYLHWGQPEMEGDPVVMINHVNRHLAERSRRRGRYVCTFVTKLTPIKRSGRR